MKKLAFCLITTLLSFILLPIKQVNATTVKTDSMLVSKPFQYTEIKPARLKTIRIYTIEMSKSGSAGQEYLQPEEKGKRQKKDEITGALYVSYGIEFIITLLVIILL